MLWWKIPCVFANKGQEKKETFAFKEAQLIYEVCQPTLFLTEKSKKTTTKSSYLLNIAQTLHIKPNTLETLSSCSHPSRAQSQYREH